jgi:hypothetical protein
MFARASAQLVEPVANRRGLPQGRCGFSRRRFKAISEIIPRHIFFIHD